MNFGDRIMIREYNNSHTPNELRKTKLPHQKAEINVNEIKNARQKLINRKSVGQGELTSGNPKLNHA